VALKGRDLSGLNDVEAIDLSTLGGVDDVKPDSASSYTLKDAFMHGDFSSVVVKAPTNAGTQVGSEGVKTPSTEQSSVWHEAARTGVVTDAPAVVDIFLGVDG
jgi:phosphate-selective porin